ncbi:UbiB [Gracilaria domingensis]|nr:UbiB [Gracilaria domingensis]
MDAPTARQVIEEELQKLGLAMDVFESLDVQTVLGSASIAQVHRGGLRNGNVDVAVKIQYRNIESLMMADLANFRLLGEILQRTELKFDLVRPVQELSRQLALEFDFKNEARNMAEIRYALRKVKQMSVPEAIPGLVSRRLLVMTFLDGIPLTKLDGALEKRETRTVRLVGRRIMKNLTACYGKMILTDGFFQADCTCLISYRHAYVILIPFLTFRMCAYLFRYMFAGHPGNIIVRNDRVDSGLLDFGQTKRFSNETRLTFVTLVDAMARKDTTGKKRMDYAMFDTASVPGVSDNPFGEESTMKEGSIDDLRKDLFLLLRTMQILKGLCHATFNSDFSMISSWGHTA